MGCSRGPDVECKSEEVPVLEVLHRIGLVGTSSSTVPERSDTLFQDFQLYRFQQTATGQGSGDALSNSNSDQVVGRQQVWLTAQEADSVQRGLLGSPVPLTCTGVGVRFTHPRYAPPADLFLTTHRTIDPKSLRPRVSTGFQHIKGTQEGDLVPVEVTGLGREKAQGGMEADRSVELHARAQYRHPQPQGEGWIANLAGEVVEAHQGRLLSAPGKARAPEAARRGRHPWPEPAPEMTALRGARGPKPL